MSRHIKSVTVSMNTVAIPNLDVKVWTRKSELLQGNFQHYLTQPEFIRQRPFEPTDIEYDLIKDKLKGWNALSTTLL